jgi:exocyst complex component 7
VGHHIDRAVGPTAAVLKVFVVVYGLEPLLLAVADGDLPEYLAVLARLEEALGFLSDNCGLAAQFRRLLTHNSSPLAMQQRGAAATPSVVPSRVPVAIVHKLNLFLDRLVAHDREERGCGECQPSRSWSVSTTSVTQPWTHRH